MLTRLGQLTVSHSTRGKATYSLELWHDGLKKHRLIRGEGEAIVRRKAQIQIDEWEAKWSISDGRHRGISDAATRTAEAQQELDRLSTILKHTLSIDDAIEWERLKDREPFSEPKPISGTLPSVPTVPQLPREPQMSDSPYAVSLGMLDKLFSSRRERLQAEKQDLFEADRKKWGEAVAKANHSHVEALRKHEQIVRARGQKVQSSIEAWERRKSEHLVKQARNNAEVDQKQRAYEELMPEAVLEYCDLVLSLSQYPDYFPQEFEMEYDPSSKILLLDYVLPAPDQLPTLKAVKYVASTGGNEDQHITDAQASKLYDETLYQVVLRTIHELFEADTAHAVATVVFNGIVTAINRSTGNPVTACVLSLRTNREEFVNIDLGRVDPKACFKSLKGVGSSKLYGLSPIPPIMPLRREDGRFISSYEVANTLDASVNLAAMDWGDFEHLIREVFEQEFSSSGGEVKVTRASRDGGVDAIAFDPDPIRGGKIVIQAKRYTNTVSVGAVRDLYGTVLNEGAIKGVLVTTSDYGPDSYAFASGKPIVLLSGANLLHMLEKHGHKARIDLNEAKKLAAQ